MGSFAGFIMTYRRPRILEATIEKVLKQSERPQQLLIVDNDPERSAESIASKYRYSDVCYHPMGYNAGPAGAAAAGLQILANEGFDWIWWGDDDDPPNIKDTYKTLLGLDRCANRDGPPIGVIASNGSRWDWERGRQLRIQDKELCNPIVHLDIFSGNGNPIISKRVIDSVGLPNADLFFGFEEMEYALRIRQHGLSILASGSHFLERRRISGRLGIQSVKGMNFVPESQLWRQYYSYRNEFYIMREVLGRNDFAARVAFKAIAKGGASYKEGMHYGNLSMSLYSRAIRDGMAGRMGRQVEPVGKNNDGTPD